MWTGTRTGMRLGLQFSALGIALAALDLSIGFNLAMARGVWWTVLLDILPMGLFGLAGAIARRRGNPPLIVGLWAGLVYGLVAGVANYAAALVIPGKATLIRVLWQTYLHQSASLSHAQVVAAVLHPPFASYVVNDALKMALFGCIFALVSGIAPRSRQSAPASQRSGPARQN